jgi:hypothetical protein
VDSERIANEILKPYWEERSKRELEAERVAAAERREASAQRREQLRLEAAEARARKDWSTATNEEVSRELRRLGVHI